MLAVAGREWRSYFFAPAGYIIIGLFLLMSGVIFIVRTFEQGQPASMRSVFEYGTWMLLFVCPAISMRSISEERRMGTLEMLLTCPLSDAHVVIGKFVACVFFLFIMLAVTLVYVVALELHGRPDYGELACGYLGMLLAGGAYLASGVLASAITSSQVVAFLLTVFFWIGLSVGTKWLPGMVPGPFADVAFAADPDTRLRDFAIGLIDTSNVMYFASLIVVFLAAAIRAMDVRRWP
jgi:ABC-2 type transport system permease protein